MKGGVGRRGRGRTEEEGGRGGEWEGELGGGGKRGRHECSTWMRCCRRKEVRRGWKRVRKKKGMKRRRKKSKR